MKKVLLLWMFLGTFGTAVVLGEGESGICFMDNVAWKEVVKEALKQQKKIFVDCYTSWCGPCKLLAKEVFPLKEVGDFFNANFVNVKYDMEKPEGVFFGKQYRNEVKNYPTMMVVDPVSGKILHKFVGRCSAEELIFEAKQGLKEKGDRSLEERYQAGERDYLFIKDYILSLDIAGQKKCVTEVIDEYFGQHASYSELLESEENWRFFSAYFYDACSDLMQFVIRNHDRLERKSYVDDVKLRKKMSIIIFHGVNRLLEMKEGERGKLVLTLDSSSYKTLREELRQLPRMEGRESCVALLKLYERLVAKEWRGAFELLTYMRVFEMQNAVRKNYTKVCMYIAEQAGDLKLVSEVLEGLREYQLDGERYMRYFNIYDSIAYVQRILGDHQAAKESMKMFKKITEEKENVYKRK